MRMLYDAAMKPYMLRLPEGLLKRVREEAKKQDRTISAFIRRALEAALQQPAKKT